MNELLSTTEVEPLNLLAALVHHGRVTEARLDGALGAAGLSSAKWQALRQLAAAAEPLPLSQLAERLTCVRSNVTQLVDRLAAEGLVRRVPDPADRRSVRAELTPAGQGRYTAGRAILDGIEQDITSRLTPAERRELVMLLDRLAV